MTRSAVLTFAVLLAVFEIGSSLRCFQCNSLYDRECMDPFPLNELTRRFLVDCNYDNSYNRRLQDILPPHMQEYTSGAPKYCAKFVTQQGATIRTCLESNPLDLYQSCRMLERGYDNGYGRQNQPLQHCSICDRDTCNSSTAITASMPIAFLALVATYLFYKQ